MGKAPADQFFWGDWLNDHELQMASDSTRGVWINALCRMWYATERGKLEGSRENLIKIIGCDPENFDKFTQEVTALGFAFFKRQPNGNLTLINRRMFKRAKSQKLNRIRQKKFYDKRHPNAQSDKNLRGLSSSSLHSNEDLSKLTTIEDHEKPIEKPTAKPWSEINSKEFFEKIDPIVEQIKKRLKTIPDRQFPYNWIGQKIKFKWGPEIVIHILERI